MRLLYVPLRRQTLETLAQLAQDERRRPQEQAAYLIEQALKASAKSDHPGHLEDAPDEN